MYLWHFEEINQIERGFESTTKRSLKSFSINFFIVLIIFIIFDLELFFVFPLLLKKIFFSQFFFRDS